MEFGWAPAEVRRYRRVLQEAAKLSADGGVFTRTDWRALGELGVLGAAVPVKYKGEGLGALGSAHVFEALGRGCRSTGLAFAAAAHLFACAMPIHEFGGDSLRDKVLPGMCKGELVAGNAVTEAGAGSDVSRIAMTARKTTGGFLLDGTKTFVSNGPVADWYVTYARTEPASGFFGLTAFLVQSTASGVRAEAELRKLGMDSCPASVVTFNGCFVPEENVLGTVGQGNYIFQQSMLWERACLFGIFLGVQERLLDRCVERARSRSQFGHRISEFQSVSNRIVNMKLRLESSRLLLYQACWLLDSGESASMPVALAKLAASESALDTAVDAMRLFGGDGYLAETGVEAAVRDALGGITFSGTSDIQRMLIAGELGLM